MDPMIVQKAISTILSFLLMFGIPIALFVVGSILLVRVFMPNTVSAGRKAPRTTMLTKVLGRREHHINGIQGIIKYYYVTFELPENDRIELKVPKSIFKSVDYEDKVMLVHYGEHFKSLEVIEKSGKKTTPDFTSGSNFTDII